MSVFIHLCSYSISLRILSFVTNAYMFIKNNMEGGVATHIHGKYKGCLVSVWT